MVNKKIIVSVEGGIIQDIQGIPYGVEIEVRDYDIDDADSTDTDENGDRHTTGIWTTSEVCYHWNDINGGSCGLGFECAFRCGYFTRKYQCKGGLIYPIPITPELCVECKKTCATCCTKLEHLKGGK